MACAVVVTAVMPVTSAAQTESSNTTIGFGLRAGLGLDPDQFVVGGQFAIGKRLGIAKIVPSVDLGFGSDVMTIDFNGDLLFKLNMEGSELSLYGGGGPTVAFWDSDFSDGSWELGLSVVVGVQMPLRALKSSSVEARFGIGDIPDVRLLLGILI
jgi:hypothetical protein